MFRTIVVGYEGPDRGDEAIALAEVLRDQPNGTLLLTSAYPPDSPARALAEVSEAERADLVVVGSSHRGALGRVVPGTTAEWLLHGAPCALAVPPRGYKGGDVRHVGVAYDGSPEGRGGSPRG